MMRFVFVRVAAAIALLGAAQASSAWADAAPPNLGEVYGLIRTNLGGMDQAEIDRRALGAMLAAFGAKITGAEGQDLAPEGKSQPGATCTTEVYDGQIAYVRLNAVEGQAATEIRKAYDKLAATNKLKGLVLDLRFAGGDNYQAAAAAADLFVVKERTLLDFGQGLIRSKAKTNAIQVPVGVLVNGETAGAAEALAAILRETSVGLVLGSRTAGRAATFKNFALSNGQQLRIAANPVLLGDGTAVSGKGLTPDIAVKVTAIDERAYFADAYAVLGRLPARGATNVNAPTNRAARRNEADLAREKRQGWGADIETEAPRDREPDRPTVSDPVLARAIDLLKGLAVVHRKD